MSRSARHVLGTLLSVGASLLAGGHGTWGASPAPQPRVRVIVRTSDAAAVERLVTQAGGAARRRLAGIGAVVADVPEAALARLAAAPGVTGVSPDRPLRASLSRTATAIGARWVAENLGVDGSGVGVAIIDSGVSRAHDDLRGGRVVHFADFVDVRPQPHDGYGHGTHVAGIIAGSGHDSNGARRGVAPGAHLVILRALDDDGDGYISNAIAALDYAVDHRADYNIRVINLSVAAGVYESYRTDPLTLAARRAVDAGLVVVAAAGNLGKTAKGDAQYGGITAPGNAPWVVTVGASSHNGTVDPADDTVAAFSSLGPSAIDLVSKPDLVAPGVGIESLADPGSTLFRSRPGARLWGTRPTASEPYLSLTGTSMAAPVVAGTVALMLQANPSLTPDAVKTVLRLSAEAHEGESEMAQGAGFLNARAAVELARTFAVSREARGILQSLVDAHAPAEGAWTAPCGPGEPGCRYLSGDCAGAAPACFGDLAGAVAGVSVPDRDAIVWTTGASGAVRPRRPGVAE